MAVQVVFLGGDPRELTARPQLGRARGGYSLAWSTSELYDAGNEDDIPVKMRMELLWYMLNEDNGQ